MKTITRYPRTFALAITAAVLAAGCSPQVPAPVEPVAAVADTPTMPWSAPTTAPGQEQVPTAAALAEGRSKRAEHEKARAAAQQQAADRFAAAEAERLAAEQAEAQRRAAEQAEAQRAEEQRRAAQAAKQPQSQQRSSSPKAPAPSAKPAPEAKPAPPPPPAPSKPTGPPGVPGTVKLTNRSCKFDGENYHMTTTAIFENGYTETVTMFSPVFVWTYLTVGGVEYYPTPHSFVDVCT